MDKKAKLQKVFPQIVWDYEITPDEFWNILRGKKEKGWLTQDWALIRAIEGLNYYDMLDLIPFSLIAEKWSDIRGKVRIPHIKKGLDYAVQKYNLSAARQNT